ncbi:hypothetical protein DNTS_017640 [Danionella cerebrum]|uniref:SAM domain-containing protein n=1 Tax=Danionella cerebrum TaxID=2873325 RepID=A0A553MXE3_9TELE|nr:hypothetical protein DNTS_017640 [Danionella translucida]
MSVRGRLQQQRLLLSDKEARVDLMAIIDSMSRHDSSPAWTLVVSPMAGSFDSHFARNMMWQCQLSQPDCRCYRVDGYSLLKRLPLHPLIGPRCPVQSVGQWLDNIGLVQYENHLLSNGFDNVQFMVSVCNLFLLQFSLN